MKSELLKEAILRDFKSVREFANAIDVPSTTIQSAIETANFEKMAVGTIIKICGKLNLDVTTFKPIVRQEDFTEDEIDLISLYRATGGKGREEIVKFAEYAFERWDKRDDITRQVDEMEEEDEAISTQSSLEE